MTATYSTALTLLVAIDISKHRHEVLIGDPGKKRRRHSRSIQLKLICQTGSRSSTAPPPISVAAILPDQLGHFSNQSALVFPTPWTMPLRHRRAHVERLMRTCVVVLPDASINDDLRLFCGLQPFGIGHLTAKRSIETFAVFVLLG